MHKPSRGARKHPLDHEPAAVRYALRKAGLTQAELARQLGKSQGHVSEILSGTRNAPPALLARLAEVLNCPVVVLEAKQPVRP